MIVAYLATWPSVNQCGPPFLQVGPPRPFLVPALYSRSVHDSIFRVQHAVRIKCNCEERHTHPGASACRSPMKQRVASVTPPEVEATCAHLQSQVCFAITVPITSAHEYGKSSDSVRLCMFVCRIRAAPSPHLFTCAEKKRGRRTYVVRRCTLAPRVSSRIFRAQSLPGSLSTADQRKDHLTHDLSLEHLFLSTICPARPGSWTTHAVGCAQRVSASVDSEKSFFLSHVVTSVWMPPQARCNGPSRLRVDRARHHASQATERMFSYLGTLPPQASAFGVGR